MVGYTKTMMIYHLTFYSHGHHHHYHVDHCYTRTRLWGCHATFPTLRDIPKTAARETNDDDDDFFFLANVTNV